MLVGISHTTKSMRMPSKGFPLSYHWGHDESPKVSSKGEGDEFGLWPLVTLLSCKLSDETDKDTENAQCLPAAPGLCLALSSNTYSSAKMKRDGEAVKDGEILEEMERGTRFGKGEGGLPDCWSGHSSFFSAKQRMGAVSEGQRT
ncbi:unnamed protein product [Leuciscus chuanchicus]